MKNLKSQKNTDPMQIAWLLRADLRHGSSANEPISEWFKMWWLIHGLREYPEWANEVSLKKAGLFDSTSTVPGYTGFGMSRILQFLVNTREDLKIAFDVNSDEGLKNAIAWLFVHGVREHQLATALDEKTLANLDAPMQLSGEEEKISSDTPKLTWLMFFVWKTNSELQNRFDLRNLQDRHAYLIWFLFDGIPKLKLAPMVAQRWRDWLREPVLGDETTNTVPRATYLLWQRHQQLQNAFNLQTNTGIRAFSAWSNEVWGTQSELSWIDIAAQARHRDPVTESERPYGLNLIGFAFGELGIGEDVRMAAAACEAAGIPFTVINIHPGSSLRQNDRALAANVEKCDGEAESAPYRFNLFCLTAFDTARVYLERGKSLFDGHYNIGWWPWELPVWPKNWQLVFDLVDEVWAATTFTHQMYSQATIHTPITHMPMAASVDRLIPMTRDELKLPAEKFLFLYVFDFNSYLTRKNPFAILKAFSNAFNPADSSVGLVMKTMNSKSDNPQWHEFLEECEKDSRIVVLDQTMERGEVLGLINECDAYVSLHRSEGFGRTLVEAMLFGKPVIGTDFSGNTDFLTSENGFPVKWTRLDVIEGEYPFIVQNDHAWWAEPDLNHAKTQMLLAKRDAKLIKNKILPSITKEFSPLRIGKMINERISCLY